MVGIRVLKVVKLCSRGALPIPLFKRFSRLEPMNAIVHFQYVHYCATAAHLPGMPHKAIFISIFIGTARRKNIFI